MKNPKKGEPIVLQKLGYPRLVGIVHRRSDNVFVAKWTGGKDFNSFYRNLVDLRDSNFVIEPSTNWAVVDRMITVTSRLEELRNA